MLLSRLRLLRIFETLSDSALELLASKMTEKRYSPGDVIVREGDPGEALYLIESGQVQVLKKISSDDNRTKSVARLESQDFFGEMALLDNKPTSASVVAQSDVVLLALPRGTLALLVQQEGVVAIDPLVKLLAGVSTKLRRTTQELVTVFDVSRLLTERQNFTLKMQGVLERIYPGLDQHAGLFFYRWNIFNDEYDFVASFGESVEKYPTTLEKNVVTSKPNENPRQIVCDIRMYGVPEGVLMARSTGDRFDANDFQLMETISAMLAPALATVRADEETQARQDFERRRQTGQGL